jgi:YhcH/YjgK/YiaL family protein
VADYETKPSTTGELEAHKKYIDIHCIVSGSELIGYAPLTDQQACRPYDPDNDFALFHGESSFIRMVPGMFAIFFPDDLHMPGVGETVEHVRKIVVKVKYKWKKLEK